MHDRHRKSSSPSRLTRATKRAALLIALAIVPLALGAITKAAASGTTQISPPQANAPSTGRSFAIADFDGDNRPDFANVVTSTEGSASNYWVRVKLSGSGRHFVRVAAPSGGLDLEARDVNGDNSPDLVFTSGWQKRPVAILLNDGHGNFSRVEPSRFPGAFNRPANNLADVPQSAESTTIAPPQSGSALPAPEITTIHGPPAAASLLLRASHDFANSFVTSHSGRAPPSQPSQL